MGVFKSAIAIDMGTNPKSVELLRIFKALRNCLVARLLVLRNLDFPVKPFKLLRRWAVHQKMSLLRGKLDPGHNKNRFTMGVLNGTKGVPDDVVIGDTNDMKFLLKRSIDNSFRGHPGIYNVV